MGQRGGVAGTGAGRTAGGHTWQRGGREEIVAGQTAGQDRAGRRRRQCRAAGQDTLQVIDQNWRHNTQWRCKWRVHLALFLSMRMRGWRLAAWG